MKQRIAPSRSLSWLPGTRRGLSSLPHLLQQTAYASLLLGGMTLGQLALAQAPAKPAASDEALPEVVVTAEAKKLKPDVVEHLQERRQKSAGSVEVVTPQQIELQSPSNIGELLIRVPSVQYMDEDGRGTKPDVGIRGLNPQRSQFTLLLHDGVPVQPSMYSENAGYYGVPIERVGGIEVIKGGASLRYGPHTVGGVVNFLSRDISSRPGEVILDARMDSNGSYMGNIAAGGTLDKFQYSVEYMHSGGEGFRDSLGFEIDDIDVRLGFKLSDQHQILAHFAYYDERSETPGGLLPNEFANDPSFSSKPNDEFFGNRVAFDIRSISQFDENNRLELLFYTSFFERDWFLQNYVAPNGTSNALANSNEQALRDFRVFGFEPKYTLKYNLGTWEDNILTVGGRFYSDAAKRRSKTGLTGDAREDNSVLTSEDHLETTVYAGYIENRFQITKKFSVSAGVRYENINQHRVDVFNNGRDQEQNYEVWIPSFGALYEFTDSFVAYGNISRAFAPPSFGDSFNAVIMASSTPLEPSEALTYEAGVRGKPLPWLTSDVGAFFTDFSNQVVVSGATVSNFDTQTYGLEASLELQLFQLMNAAQGRGAYQGNSEVTFLFGGTVLDSKIKNGPFNGRQVPYTATTVGLFGIQYDYKDRFNIRFQGRYVGDQFSDAANTVAENANGTNGELNAYTTFDLKALWRVNDRLTLKAGVNNLFDESYGTQRRTGTQRGIFPGPCRTAYVGVTLIF